jgi:murein DD-endopeptidase MepM/ murein hydrolase activator NlpD
MTGGIPLTNYQIGKIRQYCAAFAALLALGFLGANIYNSFIKKGVTVKKDAYVMRSGYPFFVSQKDYVSLVKSYPHDPGVKLVIHSMREGESFWNVCQLYGITIDTLIAANPFLSSLAAKKDMELVVPRKNGVLFAFNDITDVWRMKRALRYTGKVAGDYRPGLLKIISNDDIRLVFYSGKKPVLVNPALEKLYAYHNIFQQPIQGQYSSMFGDRVDPFHDGMEFHNGVDIMAQYGSPIHPTREGMVSFSGWRDGYGKTIMIQHADGYTTLYAHCSELKAKTGDWVTKDDIVGFIGSTGLSTGPHLHFSIMHHGDILNPLILVW